MIREFKPVLLFISRKEVTSQMMKLLLLIVDLRVMGIFDTHTKTLDKTKSKDCSISLGER
jgi:hypothetical protein